MKMETSFLPAAAVAGEVSINTTLRMPWELKGAVQSLLSMPVLKGEVVLWGGMILVCLALSLV